MSKRSLSAMILAYLVPGAGHFYLGYRARAIAFFSIVTLLFLIGIGIDGTLYTLQESGGSLLKILASFGTMGSGVLYFVARALGPHGDVRSITFEYGTTFMLTAGLMNLLLVLDCFDLAEGRKGAEE
jgi:TM2 domain-containing membrane protein YozV